MVIYDVVLFILPVLLLIHKQVLVVFQKHLIIMLALSCLVPVAHHLSAGFRWQMTFLYVFYILLVLVALVLIVKASDFRLAYKGLKRLGLM